MGSGILSSILRLTNRVSTLLRRSFPVSSSSSSIEDDLNELRTTMLSIEDVFNDAESREIEDESVRLWLRELRGVAYDAEDVLNEVEYEFLRCRVEQKATKRRKREEEEVPDDFIPFSPLDDPSFRQNIAGRIKDVKERLDEIARDREALHLKEEDGPRREEYRPRPPTSSFVEQSEVYGREVDCMNLIKLLFSDSGSEKNVSVIPIVGMPGVGKTTLVQLIYKDSRVQEHFPTRKWLYVSEKFNPLRLMKEIIESHTNSSCELTELVAIQERLRELLSGKRFLLVLDDVWNEENNLWKELRSALHSDVEGSRIIVTTRNEGVAKIMQTAAPAYHLNCLSDDDCWSVFSKRAFDGRQFDAYPNLVSIGRRISNKCRGLPLAAKALGGLLRYEADEEQWTDLLESNLWDVDEAGKEILPALQLSYRHLPTHLKQCFLYCSLFPKNFYLRRDQLIKLWMVQGFIQPCENDELVEDIAWDYFDDLLWRSFLQHMQMGFGNEETFMIHDLIHDLARSITGEGFSLSEDADLHIVSSEARHASVYVYRKEIRFRCAEKPKALRSLLLVNQLSSGGIGLWEGNIPRITIPNDVFSNLRCLRALDLGYTSIAELPDSIGKLKLLRFLCLRNTKIAKLPESVCDLYYLQILDLEYCCSLKELPRGLGMLVNLRHFHLPTLEHAVICMPSGIGRLTGLQELLAFNVGADSQHCTIGELKNMASLGGDLYISGLRNVARGWDAQEAELASKRNLRRLTLDWYVHQSEYKCSHNEENHSDKDDKQVSARPKGGHPENSEMPWMRAEEEEMVFESLRTHANLVVLDIKNYGGTVFPRWLGDPSFTGLVTLKLYRCENCETLPSLGMLPSLKNLYIVSLSSLRCIGLEFCGSKGFAALEKLEFQWMPEWEEWHWPEEGAFSRLAMLILLDCPKLNMQRRLIPTLKKLEVGDCHQLQFLPDAPSLSSLCIGGVSQESIWAYIEGLTELQSLEILYCENLTSLPLHNLPALKLLSIQSCSQLTSIDCRGGNAATASCVASSSSSQPSAEGLQSLMALESLKIESCPRIRFALDERLPPQLKTVEISCCPMLLEWCDGPVGSEQLASVSEALVEDYDVDQFNAFIQEMANEEEMDEDEMDED